MYRFFYLALASLALLLSACVSSPAANTPKPEPFKIAKKAICENAAASIFTDYATARVNHCQAVGENAFEIKISPEDYPINKSAWYGFRVEPKTQGQLRIVLNYENGYHRYPPKISYDGENWTQLPNRVSGAIKDPSAVMTLPMDVRPFYVSAQEILSNSDHLDWAINMSEKAFVKRSVIGRSVENQDIYMLEARTQQEAQKPYVMFVGRQHPPEVTGALALKPFSETVLGESDLAVAFREKFNVLIIPNMNPDGVQAGHWRHNKGGVDLNRDWGPFSQPETQAVRNVIRPFLEGTERMVFFLDFHSTWKNLLYTQADDEGTSPPMFARDWLEAVDSRLDESLYAFTREARHNSGKPTSKNFIFGQLGVPAITYEVGDHTDRRAIKSSAKVFAQEMMKLLLAHEATGRI